GVFELKFFFSSGLATDDGEDVSARTAKDIIKGLIDEEDKMEPLSDQRIAELLHEKGLQIARRTVAKYREQLQILPARLRRRVAGPSRTPRPRRGGVEETPRADPSHRATLRARGRPARVRTAAAREAHEVRRGDPRGAGGRVAGAQAPHRRDHP